MDAMYIRGWDDCVEVVAAMMQGAKDIEDARSRFRKLRELIRENKFEKIRYELGAFGLF